MRQYYSEKFQRKVYEIFGGNYYATAETNSIIATLLGSCVAVCLRDKSTGVVGMNHFLLPGDIRRDDMLTSPSAKYGMHAMEILINAMMKLGAKREHFEAKVFGGGHVLDSSNSSVPDNNIMFVKAYLAMEEIPVVAEDLGGNNGRKILYFTDTTEVYLRRIGKDQVYYLDKETLQRAQKVEEKAGEVNLFGEG